MRNVRRELASAALAVLLLGVMLGTSSCKRVIARLKRHADEVAGAGSAATTATELASMERAAADADDVLQQKLDEYIKCLNALATPIFNAEKRYYTAIAKNGPTGRETYAYAYTLPQGAASSCAAGVERSRSAPPDDPKLEEAGKQFAALASEVDGLMIQAHEYFESKGFRHDKWEKGKALHPRIKEAFEGFRRAHHELHAVLDGVTKPLAQRTLARIERDEGRRLRYHRKHVLNAARDLVEIADPPGGELAIDDAAYAAAHDAYDKALEELVHHGAAHATELAPATKAHFDAFVASAEAYRKGGDDFSRCLRDAPTKVKTLAGRIDVDKITSCPDGRPYELQDTVVKRYNELVRQSNQGQFP